MSMPLISPNFGIMCGMEKAATDIYTFENLRKGGYSYVDKTAILKELADDSRGRQFFIARPRRFGKSLAISTLRCLFEGKSDLFKGLAIEPLWDWSKKWPVIHLDMGSAQSESVSELKLIWRSMLSNECARNGIAFRDSEVPSIAFSNVINDLAAVSDEGQVVVLIDEYDKPLLGHLMTPQVTEFKNALKAFYSVLKTQEGKQRFLFITGVSKFSKVSIFSDLNNLKDYTLESVAATLFGYTHDAEHRGARRKARQVAGGDFQRDCQVVRRVQVCRRRRTCHQSGFTRHDVRHDEVRQLVVEDGDTDVPHRLLPQEAGRHVQPHC